MIKWCAYCQHFIEECPPFEDYQLSHGICRSCVSTAAAFSSEDKQGLQGLTRFFDALRAVAVSGAAGDVPGILRESRQLGLRPLDLMMGVLQPLLAELGTLWAANRVTVAVEHRFSALVGALLAELAGAGPEPAGSRPAGLLLVNAPGNAHTLGLQMAEVYFSTHGLRTRTVLAPRSVPEILALVRHHQPGTVGVSLALPEQVGPILDLAAALPGLPGARPRLLIGGPAVRAGLALEPRHGITVCRQLDEALTFLQEGDAPGMLSSLPGR